MSNVECRHCGATGHSKCPRRRNVFPDDQAIAILKQVLAVEINDKNCLIVDLTLHEGTTAYEGLVDLIQALKNLTNNQLKHLVCNCDYVMRPGHNCLFDCCIGETPT